MTIFTVDYPKLLELALAYVKADQAVTTLSAQKDEALQELKASANGSQQDFHEIFNRYTALRAQSKAAYKMRDLACDAYRAERRIILDELTEEFFKVRRERDYSEDWSKRFNKVADKKEQLLTAFYSNLPTIFQGSPLSSAL